MHDVIGNGTMDQSFSTQIPICFSFPSISLSRLTHAFALFAKIKMQNYSLASEYGALEIESFAWIQLVALKIHNIL